MTGATPRPGGTTGFAALLAASPANRRAAEDGRWQAAPRKPGGFRPTPPSPETAAREAARLRYERRSNRCDACHMARAANGTCDC